MIGITKLSGMAVLALAMCAPLASAQSAPETKVPAKAAADTKDPHPATTAAAGWYGSAWFSGASPSQDSSPTRAGWYGSAWSTTTVSPDTAASGKKTGWYGSAWTSGAWQPEGGNTDKAGWMGSSYYNTYPGSSWYGTK
jgi:hypothetical protein